MISFRNDDTVGRKAQLFWMTKLNPQERSTFFATFAGWALDGMDVMVFSFVVPSLIAIWHISKAQAGFLGTSTLIISAIGGWLAGILADKFGRVRILQITILWFSIFTFLSGFTHSFSQLLITRGLQGLGFGGEWAVGSVLMGETIGARHRGKVVGFVQSGWAVGWGLAAIAYAAAFSWLPPEIAWRTLFWIGILPAFLIFYIRARIPDSATYIAARAEKPSPNFLHIFSPPLLKTTILCSLMAVGIQGGYYAIVTWLPSYLKLYRGLSIIDTGAYIAVIVAGSFLGYICAAYLADALGRKKTLVLFAGCSYVAVILYTILPVGNSMILLLGFPLGFFASGSFSPIGAFFTELFPNSSRGSGQGFTYNIGRAVGALFPALVGVLATSMTLGQSIAVFAGGAYAIMIASILFLPETRGKVLLP